MKDRRKHDREAKKTCEGCTCEIKEALGYAIGAIFEITTDQAIAWMEDEIRAGGEEESVTGYPDSIH